MGETSILPILTLKILRKKVILLLAGSIPNGLIQKTDPLRDLNVIFAKCGYFLSDYIMVYSQGLIEKWGLQDHVHKILVAHEHFLDLHAFNVASPLSNRPLLIGYIGRLSEEKGIPNFVQALPAILGDEQNLSVLIGGNGPLKEAIWASLQDAGLTKHIDFSGWIPHDELPKFLNQLRLLVLPSHTEGLPNIMLEAMACGTPVLATPVGTIPDIIIDGKTGFIMETNSPECIAENITRALKSPNLEQIAANGRKVVEENFTFEKTVENWKRVLQETRSTKL